MASKKAKLSETDRYIELRQAEESLEYFLWYIQPSLAEVLKTPSWDLRCKYNLTQSFLLRFSATLFSIKHLK